MNTDNLRTIVQDNRGGIFEALRGLDPRLRFAAGLFVCATVAYYIPHIIIALTGIWVNNLTQFSLCAASIAILVVLNLIGNRFNKILLIGILFAVAFNLLEVIDMIRVDPHPVLRNYWMVHFSITFCCILNAVLLIGYKAKTGLK